MNTIQGIRGAYSRFEEPLHLVKKVGKNSLKLTSHFFKAFSPLLGSIKTGEKAYLKSRIVIITKISKHIGKAKLISAFAIPYIFYKAAINCKNLILRTAHKKGKKAAESILKLGKNISDLTISTGSLIGGLGEVGLLASSVAEAVSNTLFGAGTLLAGAGIGLNIRNIIKTRRFSKTLGNKEFTAKEIKNGLGIKKSEKITVKINRAIELDQEERVKNAMKKRVFRKYLTHALKIVAYSVSIIGALVLFFSPIAPIAYGLLALGAAIAISAIIVNHVSQHQLKKSFTK